ncbi:MAG: hypothetical protein QXW07_03030 [Candidatus Woesearchaeota archaeon]
MSHGERIKKKSSKLLNAFLKFRCKKARGKSASATYLERALRPSHKPERGLSSIRKLTKSSKKTKARSSVPLTSPTLKT